MNKVRVRIKSFSRSNDRQYLRAEAVSPSGVPAVPQTTPSALPVIAGVGVVSLIAAIASGVFRKSRL